MEAPKCDYCGRPVEYEITQVWYNSCDVNGTPERITIRSICLTCYKRAISMLGFVAINQ